MQLVEQYLQTSSLSSIFVRGSCLHILNLKKHNFFGAQGMKGTAVAMNKSEQSKQRFDSSLLESNVKQISIVKQLLRSNIHVLTNWTNNSSK